MGALQSSGVVLGPGAEVPPQTFDGLVGQNHVARTLKNAFEMDRVHHAFVFTGARGVGKTSSARILAKALCCEEGPSATPCGVCGSCREIASGQSVDVLEIDGASNTGVDDVRALRETVRYLPQRAAKRCTSLTRYTCSRRVRSTRFSRPWKSRRPMWSLFATTEVHKIPGTILSRCQRFDFKLIPTRELAEHLEGLLRKEDIDFEVDAVRLVARQAAGSVRDGLSLLDQVLAFVGQDKLSVENVAKVLGVADRQLLLALLEACLERRPELALGKLAQAVSQGVDLGQLAKAFLQVLRDVELAGHLKDPTGVLDLTADELAQAKGLAERAGGGRLSLMFDRWARLVEAAAKVADAQTVDGNGPVGSLPNGAIVAPG